MDSTGFQHCATVRINEDAILEYDETFEVVLTEDSPLLEIESGRATTEITIVEDGDGNEFNNVFFSHGMSDKCVSKLIIGQLPCKIKVNLCTLYSCVTGRCIM